MIAGRSGTQGQPLRFIAIVLIMWIGGRILANWPWPAPPALSGALRVTRPLASRSPPAPMVRQRTVAVHDEGALLLAPPTRWAGAYPASPPAPAVTPPGAAMPRADDRPGDVPPPNTDTDSTTSAAPPPPLPPVRHAGERWSASGWIFHRRGRNGALASGGRLGGSQAGLRIDHDLTGNRHGRMGAYVRGSSALDAPAGGEAALGLLVRPAMLPGAAVGVERRMALSPGGRNAFAAIVTAGFGPAPALGGLDAEGYGQGGMVGLRRNDAFADGRIALTRSWDSAGVRVGLSMSGGAQPGVARLDIGPVLDLRIGRAGQRPARLIVEWRERVAGDAAPGSGLALTLARDF